MNVTQPAVTISFAGAKPVRTISVSAMLDPEDADADEGRFSALRRFKVETCDGRTANCSLPTSWKPLYTSPADAFPARRPAAAGAGPDAAHVRRPEHDRHRRSASPRSTTSARGGPDYQASRTTTRSTRRTATTASDQGTVLHAAEFEVFGQDIAG